MKKQFYDPSERALEKQATRQCDADDLMSERVDAQELRRRNAFSPANIARSAEIIEWKEFE